MMGGWPVVGQANYNEEGQKCLFFVVESWSNNTILVLLGLGILRCPFFGVTRAVLRGVPLSFVQYVLGYD
jgi:hypothetical protein